ncbi:hypothetical protein FRUB_04913 [Fimbriiglobus ruber]|uniref:Uncharacterized protein n=1 Tax=Fimbriiglobus ruber TaxID=1908690 RepID=A0A225DHR9_9BACT|nr:hypothetical protein FRUB_04913 [Fimbriiglobus ruber]
MRRLSELIPSSSCQLCPGEGNYKPPAGRSGVSRVRGTAHRSPTGSPQKLCRGHPSYPVRHFGRFTPTSPGRTVSRRFSP